MPYVSQKANSRHTMFTANFVPKGQRWRFQQMDGRGRGLSAAGTRGFDERGKQKCLQDRSNGCLHAAGRCTESAMTQHPVRCVVSSLTGTRPATGFSVSVYRLIWYGWHFLEDTIILYIGDTMSAISDNFFRFRYFDDSTAVVQKRTWQKLSSWAAKFLPSFLFRRVCYRINNLSSQLSPSSINLVPAQAGKVTVGLASHWPCVTDTVYPPTGSTAKGREMSTHAPSGRGTIYLRPLCSRLKLDVRDIQTDVRYHTRIIA